MTKFDTWSHPRPYTDACHRRRKYGAVQPMEREGILAKLFKCERSR